jgi:hypothetical protein
MEPSDAAARKPLLVRLADRLRGAVHRWDDIRCLESREGDVIAHELNLSKAELLALASTSSELVRSLSRRLSHAGLSEQELALSHGEVLRDLRRVCSQCADHPRCKRDLKHERRAAPAKYCPNEQTLRALAREKHQHSARILPFPAVHG